MRAIVLLLTIFALTAPTVLAEMGYCPQKTTECNEDQYNQAFIAQYYCLPESDIARLRADGKSWGEINMIANAAARTGQPVTIIAGMVTQGMTWDQIACKFNVPVADLTNPPSLRQVATVRMPAGAGPTTPVVMYDDNGNVLLTRDEVNQLYRRGFDWLDVAIAANISKQTGFPVSQILRMSRSKNTTWPILVFYFGADPCTAFDVACYPFERRSIYGCNGSDRNLQRIERCRGCCTKQPAMTNAIPGKNPWDWARPVF